MLKLTLAELRHHRRRMAALLAAITISVGFIVACVSFVDTEQQALVAGVAADAAKADVVLDYSGEDRATVTARKLATTPGVAAVDPVYSEYAPYVGPEGAGEIVLSSLPQTDGLRSATLASGRWPAAADEVALSASTARRAGAAVGSTLGLSRSGDSRASTVTVTGISAETGSLFAGLQDTGLVPASHFDQRASTDRAWKYLVLGDGSLDDATLAGRLGTTIGDAGSAQTADAYAADQVGSLTSDTDAFGNLLLVFGAVALLVSSVIIANTLSVLVTQRRRQIGLLRSAGASSRQVRLGVVVEAAVLGLVGSLLGVVLGVVVALAAASITGSVSSGLQVPWLRVLAAVVVGVGVTVVAGLMPAVRASRIPPIEALRAATADDPARRGSRVRVGVTVAIGVVGVGLATLALVGDANQVLLAVGGAGLSAVAIIVATPYFLPGLLRLVGRLGGLSGPSGRLAAANAVRNPGRAAATCIALMLAVGLVVTLQVGAASTEKTTTARIADSYPVDVTVGRYDGTLRPDVVDQVAAIPGVSATLAVRATGAKLLSPAPPTGEPAQEVALKALGADAGRVVQAGLGALDDRTALVSFDGASFLGIGDGQQITVGHGGSKVSLTVRLSRIPDSGSVVVSASTLNRLAPSAPVREVWAKVPDKDDAGDVLAQVRRVAATQPDTQVGGVLPESAQIDQVLDVLVTVATALLAVAVLIAVIGVGNTLGLSVLERTRESALLRALGLQRRQLRTMLVVEAVLLALVASVVGVVVGIGFGWLGTAAVSRQAELHRTLLVVPLAPTLAVVAVALVAGALASVLPARRAAQAAPTAALADV